MSATEICPAKGPEAFIQPPLEATSKVVAEERIVQDEEAQNLRRGLEQRHTQMIAIAGAIGTGLFLGLGSSIASGGPLGALLGYMLIGVIVCAIQIALGEVSALMPVTGSFVRHVELLVDPGLGFAIGWNVVYGCFMSVPSEISAAVVLIQYWTDLNTAIWVTILIILSAVVALLFIRVYGELEFCFAILKILLIIGIVLMGLVIDLGGVSGTPRLGFHYWKDPGPFSEYIASGAWGRFLGFWAVLTTAVYSFSGVESLTMAAAEMQNPRRNIPRACKRVFARVTIFYIIAVLIVGMLVPSTDPRLNDYSGTAATSPFVIAAADAGIKVVPSIINAVVLTSAWSSSNQSILAGTRTLYGLALKGHAPKIFLRTTRHGVPYMCAALQIAVSCLAYLSCSNGAYTVFNWLLDLTSAGVLVSWITIALNHIRLIQGFRAQGLSTRELPWHNWWSYHSSWFALVSCIIILFTGGFTVFTKGNWDPASFVSSYLDIPLVLALYLGYKFWKKTRLVSVHEMPLEQALQEVRDDPHDEPVKTSKWSKFNILWG
ncbi:amino acid transporter [Aspergillus saccharolyticus JOP 1030-1]|uniref:Amino acid transporter n=1 Tax=Aspergillus saccharolyticus JOP 1030-1 TaxID=1450539 RepID=A0A318Z965_9EURO|nr:amino acid transporter [Aspergillus saccharolyticus JOP 1030-1]PYH42924.1 amino acid transporter [Aspergillus saccharolyticus JOP 1030-1]